MLRGNGRILLLKERIANGRRLSGEVGQQTLRMGLQPHPTLILWLGPHILMRICSNSILCEVSLLWAVVDANIVRSLTPSLSRSQTPVSSARNNVQTRSPPPLRSSSALSPPSSQPRYPRLERPSSNDWAAEDDDVDDDEQDESQQYMDSEYVDEDEFGLPSISSMRRGVKRIPRSKIHDPGGGRETRGSEFSLLNTESSTTQPIAHSSDIAEERGPLEYPTAKKSEGKILRPQYKDILRGLFPVYIMRPQAESIRS